MEEFSGDSIITNKYFKGNIFTPIAREYKKNNPLVTDEEIVLASENNIYNVWTSQSIKTVIRETTLIYYLFIFTIVSSISLLIEVLNKRKQIQPKKT